MINQIHKTAHLKELVLQLSDHNQHRFQKDNNTEKLFFIISECLKIEIATLAFVKFSVVNVKLMNAIDFTKKHNIVLKKS